MEFKPGDKVRFLNDVGEATVMKMIDDTKVLVEDEDGFDFTYEAKELVLVGNRQEEQEAYNSKEVSIDELIMRNSDEGLLKDAQKDFKVKYKNENATNTRRKGEMIEVDLHIHELMETDMGLDPHDKRDIQMRHFDRMMSHAQDNHIACIVFIHGVGQGVLRSEIRKALEAYYPNASFHDADYNTYGYGATEVRLNFN